MSVECPMQSCKKIQIQKDAPTIQKTAENYSDVVSWCDSVLFANIQPYRALVIALLTMMYNDIMIYNIIQ